MTGILSDTGPLARLPWRPIVWGGAAALYAVPVVAWFAVDGMLWDGADFVFAAVMIFGSALLVEIGLRSRSGSTARSASSAARTIRST